MMKNPYASPEFVVEEDSPRGDVPVVMRVRFGDVVRAAWKVYSVNKRPCFDTVFTGVILTAILLAAFWSGFARQMDRWREAETAWPVVTAVIGVVVISIVTSSVMGSVMLRALTRLMRGKNEQEPFVFASAQTPPSAVLYAGLLVIGWAVLMAAVYYGTNAIFGYVVREVIEVRIMENYVEELRFKKMARPLGFYLFSGTAGVLVTLAWLTLTGPGVWLTVEKKIGPFRALAVSARMIGYNIKCVLLLWLWSAVALAAGVAALGIGICWALPFVCMMYVTFCMMAAGERV